MIAIRLSHKADNLRRKSFSSREAGFSILELLLVIAILMVVAAIALPALTEPSKAANEAAAIAYMKTWSDAQEKFMTRFGRYASSDSELVEAGLIPGEGAPAGYTFRLDNPPGSTERWWGSGNPADPRVTGDRYFFIASDGVLRFSLDGPAGLNSPPLAGGSTSRFPGDEQP